MAAFVNVAVNLLVSTNASMVNKELVLKCAVFFTLFLCFLGGEGGGGVQGTCYGVYVATAV